MVRRRNPSVGQHPDFFGYGDLEPWQVDPSVKEPFTSSVHVPLSELSGRELARLRWYADLDDDEREALKEKADTAHNLLVCYRHTELVDQGHDPARLENIIALVKKMRDNDEKDRKQRLKPLADSLVIELERRRDKNARYAEQDEGVADQFQSWLNQHEEDIVLTVLNRREEEGGGYLGPQSQAKELIRAARDAGGNDEVAAWLLDPANWRCDSNPEYPVWLADVQAIDTGLEGGDGLEALGKVDLSTLKGWKYFTERGDEDENVDEMERDFAALKELAEDHGFGIEQVESELPSVVDRQGKIWYGVSADHMGGLRERYGFIDTVLCKDTSPVSIGFVIKDFSEFKKDMQAIIDGAKADATVDEPDVVYKFTGKNDTPAGASAKGMYVVELTTKAQLRKEGAALGICIGNPAYGHPQALAAGETRVFSLRTESGKPKFTIELELQRLQVTEIDGERYTGSVQIDEKDRGVGRWWSIAEVKGKANRLPGFEAGKTELTKPDEVRALCEFLMHLGFSKQAIFDASDMKGGVKTMLASGVSPFEPPPMKKRQPRQNPSEGPYPVPANLRKVIRDAYNEPMGGVWGTG